MKISHLIRNGLRRILRILQAVCVFLFQFVMRRRDFCDSMMIGTVLAAICLTIPILGKHVAIGVMVIAGFIGLIRELRSALSGAQGPNQNYFEQY